MAAVTATLSRGGTDVDIPVLGSASSVAVARDIGKPTVSVRSVGREDPIIQDNLNAVDVFTVMGILRGSNAYSDAKTLAESVIKPRLSNALSLDLSDISNRGTYDVVPNTAGACTLTYQPGVRDLVGVQLSLTVVDEVAGGSQDTQSFGAPDSGEGIKLERGGNSVTLSNQLTVTRKVGRPNGKLGPPQPATLPNFVDQNKPASDVFELSGRLLDNADADSNTLEETIARPRLGSSGITLHFLSGLFELDAYPVVPDGSAAVRTTYSHGQTEQVNVPTLKFRVISEI